MRHKDPTLLLFAFVFTAWVGCSSSDKPAKDQGPLADASQDGRVNKDQSVDGPIARRDLDPFSDLGRALDLPSPDADMRGRTCGEAIDIVFEDGKAEATAQILPTDDDNTVELTATDCVGKKTPGPDRFFKVTLSKDRTYRVVVAPVETYRPAIYVFTNCADVAGSCIAGSDTVIPGRTEELSFKPPTSGEYIIGVDSQHDSDRSFGSYTLKVMEDIIAPNDTCIAATPLVWNGDEATARGDTTLSTDQMRFDNAGFCPFTNANARELFYSVDLEGGKSYLIKVTPSFEYNVAAYVFTDCGDPAKSCVDGADANGEKGVAEVLVVRPEQNATYYIAVDSFGQSQFGAFTVQVTPFTEPANDSCDSAEKLKFDVAGVAKVNADTTIATSAVELSLQSCALSDSPGRDLFYAIDLKANKTYTIEVTPDPWFDPIVYVFSECGNEEGSCLEGKNRANQGEVEIVKVSPNKDGTYFISVDSTSYEKSSGSFSMVIKE